MFFIICAVGVVVFSIEKIGTQSKADEGNIDADSTWDDVHMLCPNQCVCQHAPLMDLSIARWMQEMRREAFDDSITTTTTNGEKITSNEVRRTAKFRGISNILLETPLRGVDSGSFV